MMPPRALEDAIRARAGGGTARFTPVGGGSIHQAARVDCGNLRCFAKWNPAAPPGCFAAEAEGLRALRSSGTSLSVPEPLEFGDGAEAYLLLEWIEPAPRAADFDERLGRGLAELHRAGADRCGFAADGYCGATPQPNGWLADWIAFFRDRRLLHQIRIARARGMAPRDVAFLERLAVRVADFLRPPERPSLLHGDLWSGNVLSGPDGRPALVDPAAYFGHREADLGMMRLFGGFSERVYSAYGEAWPLEAGWERRADLYGIYHLLNHFALFGGSYGTDALALARRFLRG